VSTTERSKGAERFRGTVGGPPERFRGTVGGTQERFRGTVPDEARKASVAAGPEHQRTEGERDHDQATADQEGPALKVSYADEGRLSLRCPP
jgi:hypothetical protein